MLAYFVIIPILIAVFLYVFPSSKAGRLIAVITQTALVGLAFYLFFICKSRDVVSNIGNYESFLGITLRADALSSVFIILTSFIFLIVAVYTFNEKYNGLFWFLLFIWEGLLIGIFLSRDLFNIFVLVEVTTVAVAVLIMFNRDNRSMYDGMVYLMINTVAVQFYLFGTGYVYKLTGVLDIDAAAKVLEELDKSSLILPYALIITAISLKCALVPLFSWLPKAHGTPGAPSAVSAILSGLHIKGAVYLFIQFNDLFKEVVVSEFFLIIGIITGIVGFIFAMSQKDIKLILAYSTISQIGMIITGLNNDDIYSYTGSLYHIFNHALFKSALFLSAGIIIKIYNTRDIYKIRGVLKRSPLIGAVIIMAILGIIGTPFFNGSVSKYFIFSGTSLPVGGAILLINLGTIITFIRFSSILFGKPQTEPDPAKTDKCKQAAVLVLGTLCLVGGILGEQLIEFLFNVKVSVDTAGYLQKSALFTASAVGGYLIYKLYIKNSPRLKQVREIELSFRGMCVSVGAFFAVVLVVTKLFA
ncbi:MAG: proton-conducting membrane transporter [Oscillospiraceae bacterium]|nr:proton-conducting membrane transporter [Oscillospiraceae bacterium]